MPLRRSTFSRRPRSWLLAALALAVSYVALGPARWLRERVQADQSVLGLTQPPYKVAQAERVLVVSPHLDDETLGAGGLLTHLAARKIPTRVVFLSNGDGSGSTILALNFRHGRRFSFVESARLRQKEALAALEKLGIPSTSVAFLGYPDGDLQTMWDRWNGAPIRSRFTQLTNVPYEDAPGAGSEFRGANLLRDLEAQMEQFAPTRVLSTHGADAHPDHWSADAFARLALQVLAARQPQPRAIEHDGFVIHHGIFPLPHGNHPRARLGVPAALLDASAGTFWRSFELSDAERRAKGAALEEYQSQLVFTPNYLRAFVRRNEPLGRASDGLGSQTSQAWHDETQESWFLARHPGTDIIFTRAEAQADGLRLVLSLAAPPAPGVLYRFNIKCIFAAGHVRARFLEVRAQNNGLVASEPSDSRALLTKDPKRFAFWLSWNAFGGAQKPRALVIDASTWSGASQDGGAMLDRTESRAIVLR